MPRRTRRCITLGVVVELDHLDAIHMGGRQLTKAHEQHRSDGEVGRHDRVGRRIGEELGRPLEVAVAQAGGPDHSMDSVAGVVGQIGPHGVGHTEVDHDLGPVVGQRRNVAHDRQPRNGLTIVAGVYDRDELEIRRRGHGKADLAAHPAAGSDHTDLAHRLNPTGQLTTPCGQ